MNVDSVATLSVATLSVATLSVASSMLFAPLFLKVDLAPQTNNSHLKYAMQ